MSQCPLCAAQVRDDFGLIECSECGAQLLVHMDGRVEYSGAQVQEDREEEESKTPVQDTDRRHELSKVREISINKEEGHTEINDFEFGTAAADQEPPPLPHDPDPTEMNVHEFNSEEPQEPPPAPVEESPAAAADATEALQQMPQEPEPEVYKPPVAQDSPDLSDVARFGNSEASGSREGSLRYNLFITGIDTADVRESFREALTDRKLVWDTEQILRSVRNGEVKIQNVTPPKAYILISRLRGVPVQVRWEQYAISST